MTILPSARDKKPVISRPWWEGYILQLDGGNVEIIATVRGKTMKEMRKRKWIIYQMTRHELEVKRQGEQK